MKTVIVGDPMDSKTELGPIARHDLLIELKQQVALSSEQGAKVLAGGNIIDSEGFYFEPTVLVNVKKEMSAYSEEIFGPVAVIYTVYDVDEAVSLANDSPFGLGASLWTQDIDKAKTIASEIETGSLFINGLVKSDPRLPFGGVKLSGFGRELSHYGMKEFVNIKSVWIK